MERTAVVGFGCAGYYAVKTMREKGYAGEIHIYCIAPDAPANPMLTTYYVSGKIPLTGIFPFGTLEELQKQFQFTMHAGSAVSKVDSARRMLTLENGDSACFDHIVLTAGASALVPPIPGAGEPDVYTMRTVQDAQLLKDRLALGNVHSAVIIGASMVGIKLAEIFCDQGIDCTLADMAPHIFPTATLPSIAEILEERITARGIKLKFSSGISAIEKQENGLAARFQDGTQIPCDIVLLCMGTRANTRYTDDGIEVRRGIVVDEQMRTSAAEIYAAGDCCEGNNLMTGETQIIGLWDNAAHQGRTAGANIAGEETFHKGSILQNITHFMNMDFIGLGDNRAAGTHHLLSAASKQTYLEVVEQENCIKCINLLDHYKISGVLKNYLLKCISGQGKPLGNVPYARLLSEGVPADFIHLLEGLKQDHETGN